MAKLFPTAHVIGFLSSIVLTLAALSVLWLEITTGVKMTILIVTALLQASLQLFLFMHIGESKEKTTLYISIAYAVLVGLITIFGSLLTLVWDM